MAELATIARPYAKALYGLATEQNKLEPWLSQLKTMALLVSDAKVAAAIDAPEQGADERVKTLLGLLPEGSLDPMVQNFVATLSENGRLSVLPEIYTQYQALSLAKSHIQQATIYSAYPMSESQFAQVVSDLQTRFGSKLQAELVVKPDLIGGVKVEIGDQVLDMSVQGQLQALYAAMIN